MTAEKASTTSTLYRKRTYSGRYKLIHRKYTTHHYPHGTIVFHELSGYILVYILLSNTHTFKTKRMQRYRRDGICETFSIVSMCNKEC